MEDAPHAPGEDPPSVQEHVIEKGQASDLVTLALCSFRDRRDPWQSQRGAGNQIGVVTRKNQDQRRERYDRFVGAVFRGGRERDGIWC